MYTNAHTLINSLRQDGHIIEAIENTFCHEEDHDALNIAEIKELNQKRMDFAFDELANQLIVWHNGDRNAYRLRVCLIKDVKSKGHQFCQLGYCG